MKLNVYRCATPVCAGVMMLSLVVQSLTAETNEMLRLPQMVIIGTKEQEQSLSGSGTYLDTKDLRAFELGDVHEILRQAPGVYVREEEGYGLRQNVSLRGVDTTRSGKVTLMEDGVLTAPSPYSSPASYYTPNIHRMSAMEILKGSSQVRFGPLTTGGVMNYLSTPIPDDGEGCLRFLYSTDNEIRGQVYYGDEVSIPIGRVGYLAELFTRRADGFKHIDRTPDFRDGNDTGFTLVEPMLKLSWDMPTEKRQSLECKIGYSDLENQETYLGITDEDFRKDPMRRYAASRFDELTSHNTRTYLRHFIEWTDDFDLTTTVYYQGFHRNWYKLDSLRNLEGGTNTITLAEALATPGAPLETLRGANGGTLRVRANNRDHSLAGVETAANYRFHTGDLAHEALLGVRYHTDAARQYQWQDDYYQTSSGVITNIQLQVGGMGAAGNRQDQTDALALFVQDSMCFGRFTLTPGARYEHLEQEYYDRNATDPSTHEGTLDVWATGLGFNYLHDPKLTLFGGVYRGFSVPDPRASVRDGVAEETSLATELGLRWQPRLGLHMETTLFYTRFDDLIVIDLTVGAGAIGNAGNVNCYGVEWRGEYDPCAERDWGIRTPLFATATFTQARLDGDAQSSNPESIFCGGKDGNDVPYIPDWQLMAGAGLHFQRCGAELRATFVNETYTTANNSTEPINPVTGSPDVRCGKTDAVFTVDLTSYYQLNRRVKITGGVQNLLDREYIVSRHPYGPRPGKPLTAVIGVEVKF